MGARYAEARIYQIPAQYIMNELRTLQFCQLQRLQLLSINPTSAGATFWYRHGASSVSWGERICVSVASVGPYSTRISIQSECEVASQMADWGQNRNNALAIYSHLERYVMQAGQPAPAPTPNVGPTRQCPHCPRSIATSAQFCTFCGYSV